jgi:hypothetical protein
MAPLCVRRRLHAADQTRGCGDCQGHDRRVARIWCDAVAPAPGRDVPVDVVQAGEEVGWRGYALPRLAARMGLGPASVLLGIVWAVWHLPLFYIAGTGSDEQSFPLYAMHVTAVSVAMAWLYWKSGGSLLLVMLMHAAVNNIGDIVPASTPGVHDVFGLAGSLVGWISAGLSWLVAFACLFTMRSVRELTEGDTVWNDAMKGSRSAS